RGAGGEVKIYCIQLKIDINSLLKSSVVLLRGFILLIRAYLLALVSHVQIKYQRFAAKITPGIAQCWFAGFFS
uniref:hypothetical protein n=1 Tax=Fischerella thermalis TaxID=372787 RepID=UPI00058FB605